MLRILVDVSVGRVAEDWLKSTPHDVVTVRDVDRHMPDIDILRWAFAEGRIVITMDKDFGELVYRINQPHAGILLLRMENQVGREKVRVLTAILDEYADEMPNRFCVYQDQRFRIR